MCGRVGTGRTGQESRAHWGHPSDHMQTTTRTDPQTRSPWVTGQSTKRTAKPRIHSHQPGSRVVPPPPTSCRPHRARHCPAPRPGRPAPPRPARSPRDLYRARRPRAGSGAAAALPAARPPPARPTRGPPPCLRPPCVPGRRGHCGRCPGGPWRGPWASLALWARGTPRPVSGAAGRGGWGGPPTWACPECGPGSEVGGRGGGGRER